MGEHMLEFQTSMPPRMRAAVRIGLSLASCLDARLGVPVRYGFPALPKRVVFSDSAIHAPSDDPRHHHAFDRP
jgi:hypothetical protein